MSQPASLESTGRLEPASGPLVLVVEDELAIGQLIRSYLGGSGYRVLWVRSGEDALAELARHEIRIVVLDIGLPGIDGFDVCREIRNRSDLPIVMLTARDEEIDRVLGLEVGADDYVAKPFSPRELTARLKAVLRRTDGPTRRDVLALGDVELRRDEREVRVAGELVDLTVKEFDLLAWLVENARHRLLARPAARPGLGHDLRGRHAHRRRPRRPGAPEAPPASADPHGPRLGVQGRPRVIR